MRPRAAIPLEARNALPPETDVGHARFRYPRAIRERLLHPTIMIRKSSTLTATYCLLTTVVSNTATSPTTLTRMAAPAFTVQ